MREVIDFLFKLLLAVVNFFIYVGEFTKFLLFLPIRLIVEAHKISNNAIFYLISRLKKVPDQSRKILTKIRPRKKPLQINLFKPKVKQSRFTRLLFFYLVNKPRALLNSLKDNLPRFKIRRLKGKKRVYPPGFKLKYFLFGVGASFMVVFINNSYFFIKSLPSPKSIGKVNYSLSTHIYDRDGRLLYEFYREQNRTPAKLGDLPSYLWEASIAIEDKDFFKHNGVAPIGGIIRALKENIINDQLQGGSTITQQLEKSALLTPERTIQRKVKEVILAVWSEKIFSKNEILEMYMNQVPYGGSSYGIEQAAKTYFNKSAQHLTLPEASFLAGLPQAPPLYSPYVNPEGAIFRRNDVALKMKEIGLITQKQYDEIIGTRLIVAPIKTYIKAPHFVFYVRSLLEEMYGNRFVEEGGLTVTTTLDFSLQEKVEDIL